MLLAGATCGGRRHTRTRRHAAAGDGHAVSGERHAYLYTCAGTASLVDAVCPGLPLARLPLRGSGVRLPLRSPPPPLPPARG
jgi:hypothetical protein